MVRTASILTLRSTEGAGPHAARKSKVVVSPQAFLHRMVIGEEVRELRQLRQLREENRKLKTLVADLMLDKYILQEVLSKKV